MNRIFLLLSFAFIFMHCGETTAPKEMPAPAETEVETPTVEEPKSAEPKKLGKAVINANLGTVEDLSALVSPEIAQKIVDNRPFLNMNDMQQLLTGAMDQQAMDAFLATCFVPLNLNEASEAEFKMIPGVGDKMAHEFEEYRPYKKIAQFRREMGKYVDAEEIARYEQFVFVPVELNTATDEEILGIPGVGDKMLHEFKEYRPYKSMEQFRREIGKYVNEKELARLERFVVLDTES